MHNRVGPEMRSAELSGRDALVLVPLVLSILALAIYPQVALDKSEPAVGAAVEAAR
jgi:NADH-quinone oxidoreductase subunit M